MNSKQSMNRIIEALRRDDLSNKDLVQRTGLCRQTVNFHVNALKQLEAIHICRYRASGARQEAIYSFGEGDDAVLPKPQKTHVTFLIEDQDELPAPNIGLWHDAIFPRYTPAP